MATRQFPREFLIEELDLPDSAIENTAVDSGRWTETREIIFEYEGKFYRAYYEVGLTEYQEVEPWEFVPLVDVQEVTKQLFSVYKWVGVTNGKD